MGQNDLECNLESHDTNERTPENGAVAWRFHAKQASAALQARGDFVSFLKDHSRSFADENAAAIIFTELVANVVRHAPGPITITLEVSNVSATLRVADSGPGFTCIPSLPCNPFSENGRGLFIVSQYAADLQIERREGAGASVSATMRFNKSNL